MDAGGPAAAPDPIAELRPFEDETRRSFDFRKPPSAETGMGADPWMVRRVAGNSWVGILRGRSALVLLDDELHELARVPAPRSPTGLAIGKNGDIFVVGELSPAIARFAVRGRSLVALGETRVAGAFGLRDVAVAPDGVVWALDERGGRLLRNGSDSNIAIGHGCVQLIATAKHVVVNAALDHELVVVRTDGTNEPVRIKHDGPIWGFDARETDGGLVVAAGGVEDHPLDRKGGFFGYIDSFLYAYRVPQGAAQATSLAALNVSEHGIVTPKAIAIEAALGDTVDVFVTPYGSATGAHVRITARPGVPEVVTPVPLVPGIRALERVNGATASAGASGTTVMANPLLDAWVRVDRDGGVRVVPVAGEAPRPTGSRLGEALFFTSLMAPKNTSAGALSRFTCETCHFEGYVDGRTHHTGREDIHATTKPLVGLVGNRPYFSRALDPDMSTIAHAEFRVAGAGSGTDPFFAVEPRDHAWLEHVAVTDRTSALDLRRALMRFLTDLSHRPNAAVVGRTSFDATEREGARLFRDRCEGCHSARLSADNPATRVAFEEWEPMVLGEQAPIVWGSAGYRKTGVTPYVHAEGARTPSLRRLYKKHPYFTNGSAKSIDDVLAAIRSSGTETWHANAPATAEPLDDPSRKALRAFLDLL